MKDSVLERIKLFAIKELNNAYGYCGSAEGEEMAMLNSDDNNGNNISITIKINPEDGQVYNFEYVKGQGLQARIDKEELAELMEDEKEEARLENERDRIREICNRTDEEQGYHDSGMRPSDFN